MQRKGIILAGGTGSRLFPATKATCKQLLPVYDKPLIFYPLSVLLRAGIKDILIITRPEDQQTFFKLLGNGSRFCCNIQYTVQHKPSGIAEAFKIGKEFINNTPCMLALGDNVFYGPHFSENLASISNDNSNVIFGYRVKDPSRYGVIKFNPSTNAVLDIVEKPKQYVGEFAVPGLYMYDETVCDKVMNLKPSARGELEITDLNNLYIHEGTMKVSILPSSTVWFDTGTPSDLLEAAEFVRSIQDRTGMLVGSPEVAAYDANIANKEEITQHLINGTEYENNVYRSLVRFQI